MKIENRRKKLFSDKLFNELILIYLFSQQAAIYEYEIDMLIKKSKRTFYRYLEDLKETGLFKSGINCVKDENGNKKYIPYYKDISLPSDSAPILMLSFVLGNPSGLSSKNQHIRKLTRCSILLHSLRTKKDLNKRSFSYQNLNENDDDVALLLTNKDLFDCKKIYYDDMQLDLSNKTFKRDLYITLIVLFYMNTR